MTEQVTNDDSGRFRIGLVGMSDNLSTRTLITELERLEIVIDAIILQQPRIRTQWRRLLRKIAAGGLLSAVGRIWQALLIRFADNQAKISCTDLSKYEVYYTADANSSGSVEFVLDHDLDILISSTDAMLKRCLFNAPRIGTLNAHPGWVPSYRGLGALARQLGDGYIPAISVHLIDEGVDTGPVIMRREFELSDLLHETGADNLLHLRQAQCFADVLKELEIKGHFDFIDTFLEISGMTRGIPHKKSKLIMETARQNPDVLKRLSR